MKTIATIGAGKMIGSRVVQTTFEDISVCSKTEPNRVAVNVDIRGYYSPDQIDSLIEMLSEAKIVASEEAVRLQHDALFTEVTV